MSYHFLCIPDENTSKSLGEKIKEKLTGDMESNSDQPVPDDKNESKERLDKKD